MDKQQFKEAIDPWFEKNPKPDTGIDFVRTKKKRWSVSIYRIEGPHYELIYGKDYEKHPKKR